MHEPPTPRGHESERPYKGERAPPALPPIALHRAGAAFTGVSTLLLGIAALRHGPWAALPWFCVTLQLTAMLLPHRPPRGEEAIAERLGPWRTTVLGVPIRTQIAAAAVAHILTLVAAISAWLHDAPQGGAFATGALVGLGIVPWALRRYRRLRATPISSREAPRKR